MGTGGNGSFFTESHFGINQKIAKEISKVEGYLQLYGKNDELKF